MGGDTTPQSPLRGAVRDECGAPQEVAGDGAEGRKGKKKGREGGDDDDGEGGDDREQRDFSGANRDRGGQLDEGHGPRPVGVPGGEAGGGIHVEGGGPDSKGEEGLPGNWPRGGYVEGSGGDFKSPAHGLHHLPRLPPWVPGRLRDRYRHPRGQAATEASGLEGGGPVRDLHGPAKGV